MDRASGAMIYGGGGTVVAANSDKVDKLANSDVMKEAVNLLHYPMFEVGNYFVAPNTICTILGIGLAIYGAYRNHKSKK